MGMKKGSRTSAAEVATKTPRQEPVNIGLERLAEGSAILDGIDEATGEIPDFPYVKG